MPSDLNLTPLLRQKFTNYPRTIGRYHASELFYLINGKTTPEEWLNPKTKPLPLIMAMWNGTVVHQYIQDLLPPEGNEIKVEYQYTIPETGEVITLVGKVDHIPSHVDSVWEFKTSKEEMTEPKEAHAHQTRLYCTMAKKSTGIVYQPVQHKTGLYLKHIETVTRDDQWFAAQIDLLASFHKEVVKLATP